MLIDLCFNLEVGEVVDLPDLLPCRDVLTEFHIEQTQFAVDVGAHSEFVFPLVYQHHVATHIGEVVLHLVHLQRTVLCIFGQTVTHELLLLLRKFVVFLGLQIGLSADELFAIESLVLFIATFFASHIHTERSSFGFVVQLVLLHGYLCVAEQVLLFRQFSFGIENLQVEIAIGKTHNHVTFLHALSFLCHLLHHDATLLGRNLHHLDRHYCSAQSHIVLELAFCHRADGELLGIHLHRTGMVAKDCP